MPIEIRMPELAPDITEADVVAWLAKPGARIALGDPIVEIETDKATVEIEAPVAGILQEILVPEGSVSVAVGTALCLVEASKQQAGPEPAAATESSGDAAASTASRRTTALARRLADRAGLDVEALTGSGRHGRVTRADVERERAAPATGGATPSFCIEADCDADPLLGILAQLAASDTPVPLAAAVVRATALALGRVPELSGGGPENANPGEAAWEIALSLGSATGPTAVISRAERRGLATLAEELDTLSPLGAGGESGPTAKTRLQIVYLEVEGVDHGWPDLPSGTSIGLGVDPPRAPYPGSKESAPTGALLGLSLCADTRVIPPNTAESLLAAIRRLLERPLEMAL